MIENGTTTLVLLPGLDGTEVLFAPLLRCLPDRVRPFVIVYPDSGTNSYDELIEHIDAQVASLESFAVLGMSFGGPLALMLAKRRPSQIRAVVLCCTFVTPPFPGLIRWRWLIKSPVIAFTRTLRRVRFWVPGFASEELRRAKSRLWWRVRARMLAARSRAAMSVDARALLTSCQAPLMYIAATDDRVVRARCRDEIVALAPHTIVRELEGSHLVLFTNPQQAADCIMQFVNASEKKAHIPVA